MMDFKEWWAERIQRHYLLAYEHLFFSSNIEFSHICLPHISNKAPQEQCPILFSSWISTWYTVDAHQIFFSKILFIYSLEKGREGEGKKHQCVVACHTPPTEDLACNPSMCPDWELNWRPFCLQASSTQPLSHTSQGARRILLLPLFK